VHVRSAELDREPGKKPLDETSRSVGTWDLIPALDPQASQTRVSMRHRTETHNMRTGIARRPRQSAISSRRSACRGCGNGIELLIISGCRNMRINA
jgi:ribosomal protein L4